MPTDNKEKNKVYTNKLEFDKANQAYGDSLNLFNTQNKFNAEFLSNFKKGFPTQDLKDVDWKEILNYVNKDKEKNANKVIDIIKNGYVPTKNEKVLKPEDALYKAKINRGDGDRLSTGYFKKNSEVNTRSLMDFIGNDDTKNYKHGSVSTKKDNIENVSDYSEAEIKTLFGDSSKEKVFGYSHKNILDKNIKPVDTLRYNQQVPNIIGSIENKDNFDPSSNTYNDVHAVNIDLPIYKKPTDKPIYQPDVKPKLLSNTPKKDYWDTDKDVLAFRKVFKAKYGEEPNRDPKIAKYDYDAAYKAGARPVLDPNDNLYHWDSKYKADDHPNRYVDGIDTKTGKPKLELMKRITGINWLPPTGELNSKQLPVPEIPTTKGVTQNYTAAKALQIQGKPSGYTNEGDRTGRKEIKRNGGWLDGLEESNPIQDNTKVKATVIPNQALIQKSNLNKNKGTLKSIDRMPEQPLTREEVRKGIKFTTDVAGLFYPPAAIAGAAMDMHQGDKTGALIGLIPGTKDFLTNKNMVTKLATKAFNLGIPNKVVQPSKKVIREAGKYIKGSAEVIEAKDDIGTPIVETVKSKLKNGGWLNNLSTNKFDMGGVLDGLDGVDKGTQVPDATATAKPVVNLNFAVTPAQKQLAAKNKRQAEIDMQVDHPEFYTNSNFLDKKAVKPYSVEDYKKGIKEPGLQTSMDPIDLVGTGAYKGLAKALGAKEVAVAADAALFNSLDKSKVFYNQVKIKAKDEIYKLKYNKDIASLESKKFNAMQKMNNPEGWKRLREQGIEPKQFFDQLNKSKITSTRDIGSFDNGAQINIDFNQVKKLQKEGYDLSVDNIIDHEIGHRMQRGFNSKAVNDYNQAKSYNLRNQVPKYHVYSTPLDKEAELLLSPVIKNPNGNSDYFLFGSDNKERLPFLREAKESMVSKGFINNIYSKITPETVKKFLKEVPSNRFSTFLDVENPITHRRLSGLLNKTPIVAGAGLGVNELAKDKKQNTGWLDNLK